MYITVTVEINDDRHTGLYAYTVRLSESDNVKAKLDSIPGLQYGNVFTTKKKADAVAHFWNQAFIANGTYAFRKKAVEVCA